MIRSRSFRAMGTAFELHLECEEAETADELFDDAQAEVDSLERILSRFDPESELSRLNVAGAGRVGPELLELVPLALEARERTHGRFDPTVHDALVAAGYDRTFEELVPSGLPPEPVACRRGVEVDPVRGRIALEHGCKLDLGGIAKGWTADRILHRLSEAGPALVNAGGDLACSGGSWPVGVETPSGTLTLELEPGGLATSGRDRRAWLTANGEAHHLIDPATGASAAGGLLTVTTAAASATEAEVQATSLFLVGDAVRAAAEADALGAPALIVTTDGQTLLVGGLA